MRRFVGDRSSWVRSFEYVPLTPEVELGGADGFLIVESQTGSRYAYAVPAWVPGVLLAAVHRGGSPGRAFNRVVRRRGFPSVKLGEGAAA